MPIEEIYGFFPGGDPRTFSPDLDQCSVEEIQRHQQACQLWDEAEARGETPTPETCPSGWITLPNGSTVHVLRARYGIGVYTIDIGPDESDELNSELGTEPVF